LDLFRSRSSLEGEVIALRHQLNVLRRSAPKRPALTCFNRFILVLLYRLAPTVLDAVTQSCGLRRIRDQDRVYGEAFTRRVRAMGIRDRPTAPRSPWQNGYAERSIGSIRRECLDHVIVFGEQHLRRVLRSYQQYYNGTRTHLSLAKDAPLPRAIQTVGSILPLPVLGGLHHHYVRI
jgi:transposase InsO family protein